MQIPCKSVSGMAYFEERLDFYDNREKNSDMCSSTARANGQEIDPA